MRILPYLLLPVSHISVLFIVSAMQSPFFELPNLGMSHITSGYGQYLSRAASQLPHPPYAHHPPSCSPIPPAAFWMPELVHQTVANEAYIFPFGSNNLHLAQEPMCMPNTGVLGQYYGATNNDVTRPPSPEDAFYFGFDDLSTVIPPSPTPSHASLSSAVSTATSSSVSFYQSDSSSRSRPRPKPRSSTSRALTRGRPPSRAPAPAEPGRLVCPECSESFKRPQEFKRHIKSVHLRSEKTEYVCCGIPRALADAEQRAMAGCVYQGTEMVGGCWSEARKGKRNGVFARKDTYKRHLENGWCVGDVDGPWHPANSASSSGSHSNPDSP